MVNSPGKLIVLSPVGALREAALGVASASTEAFCVTESPLEALWTLARNPANDLLINIRCLAFREREILQAARAASASAHLVVMAEPADELHLARVATSVDELAVGSAEVRGVAARRLSAATDERSNPGVMCVAGSIDTFSPELSASTGDSCQDRAAEGRGESLLSQAVLCLRQMTERPTADTPEALAALLSEALLTMPGVEAAALLVLEARPGAEASQLLALAGGGLSVDEALSARRVNGDRAWSSAGRRRWLMPIDLEEGGSLGLLVRLADGIDEAATLDALEPPARLAASRLEASRQRAAAIRMMTLDADTRLHRRGYLEPYIDALCRGARQRRREVLVVVVKLHQRANNESPAAALREAGLWLSETLKEARIGRWDDRTVVGAAPARDVQHIQLAQQILQRASASLGDSAALATAVFPWDGESAAALVQAAGEELAEG